MFSQLTAKVFTVYFKYLSGWTSRLEWNEEAQELRLKRRNTYWRLVSSFQIFYAVFIWVRSIQAWFLIGISVDDITLQLLHLCMYSVELLAELTFILQGSNLVFIYNEMKTNNRVFGKDLTPMKRDILGIVVGYFTIAIPIIPCFWACFFYVNYNGKDFLYSITEFFNIPNSQHTSTSTSVFLVFMAIEVFSAHVVCTNCGLLMLFVLTYSVHSSYWMKYFRETGFSSTCVAYNTFRTLQLHTIRFNEVFATFILCFKDFGSSFVIITATFAVIGLRAKLPLGFIGFMLFVSLTGSFGLFVIFCPAGWVWEASVLNKIKWQAQNLIDKRKYWAMCPFGITVGSMYVVKTHTFITLFNIIVNHICGLLIAFNR